MSNWKLLGGLTASAAFALSLGTTLPQPAFAEDAEEEVVEEVVVTGSRIKRSDFTSSSPVTVISGQAILESGTADIGEALRQQAAIGSGGFNQSSVLSGGGATSIDLRNLGQDKVLILINGKRVANFADALANEAADLTFVPSAMVERVEILRDGASAIYGSDAISGVVNVILKDDFEGVEADLATGMTPDGDAEFYAASMVMGTSSDRGNLVFGVEYRDRNNLKQRESDFAFPAISSLGTSFNNGSFFGPGGTFLGNTDGIFCTEPLAFGGDEITDVSGTAGCPSFRRASDRNDLARYDYSLQQDLIIASEVLSTAAFGTYNLTENTSVFFEMQYAKREGISNLDGNPGSFGTPSFPAGSFLPGGCDSDPSNDATESCNPNNNTDTVRCGPDVSSPTAAFVGGAYTCSNGATPTALAGAGDPGFFYFRPTSTIGRRQADQESNTVRMVLGLEGDIPAEMWFNEGWNYELSYLFTKVDASLQTNSTWNLARFIKLADRSLCAADAQCSQVVNPTGAMDVLRPGRWTIDEVDYFRQRSLSRSEFETKGWFGVISGPIVDLPAGPLSAALGFERRSDKGFNKPDSITEAGESVANQVFTTEGGFDVREFFVEIDIPLVRDMPFAEDLSINLQGRHSDFSTFGTDTVYRAGVNWQIIPDLRVRSTVSTAYKSPQVTDLFGGGTVSFDFFSDPCSDNVAGRQADPTLDGNCLADGIPQTATQAASQFAVLSGSNPDLQPETADTYTVGLIFTPTFLEGFSAAFDYWNISVDDLISRNTSDSVVDDCYLGPANQGAPECDRFDRGAGPTYAIINLVNQLQNLNNVRTDGFDFNVRYEFEGPAETFIRTDLNGTYVDDNTFYPGPGGADDRGSISRLKANTNVSVDWQDFTFGWRMRYIHGADDPRYDGNNAFNYDDVDAHLEHDLRVTWNYDNYRVLFGVNDVLDNDPPYIFGSGNNTDLFTYDPIGRYMFLRLSASL